MLTLEKYHSSGRFRDTYIHPFDDNKLVKVEKFPGADPVTLGYKGIKRIKHQMMKTLKPKNDVSGHERELMGLQLISEKGLLERPFFNGYLGEIETNKGRGLIVKRITNFYYDNVKTVEDYLNKYGQIPEGELREALNQCFSFLSNNTLWLVSGDPDNIAITRNNKGQLVLKTFDIKVYTDKRLFSWFFPKLELQKRITKQKLAILPM